jgi:quercetin dioxygenase-like cupin family protein
MCESLNKLNELTNNLPPIPNFKQFEIGGEKHSKMYAVVNGEMRGYTIHSQPELSIAKVHMTKGSLLEEHIHGESDELLVVIDGELKLIIDNRITTLKKFDHIKISKSINHIAFAPEETWLVAVTIPKDDGYPE